MPWASIIKPRIVEALSILKSKGATKFGSIGFCYGGWNLINTLSDADTPELTFGAICHPYITNINQIHSPEEKVEDFVKNIRDPVIFLPAQNDPSDYRKDGNVYNVVKSLHPDRYVEYNYNSMDDIYIILCIILYIIFLQ